MPSIPAWRVLLISLVCILGLIFALPSVITPATLERLPAWFPRHKVNLGLDLQGGSHLLLEVDVASGLQDRLAMTVDDIRKILRDNKIGYQNLALRGEAISFKLRDGNQFKLIEKAVNKYDSQYIIKLQQPDQVNIFFSEISIKQIRDNLIKQSVEIVNRRINELGTRESNVQRQGDDRIIVQLPGIQDPTHVKNLLGQTAKLTMRLVNAERPFGHKTDSIAPPGYEFLESIERTILTNNVAVQYVVDKKVLLTGEYLVDAHVSLDNNKPQVAFRFNNVGARKFGQITQDNSGHILAIVLDNKVISAPRINGAIPGGNGVITGNFTLQEATDLALLMRAGALPAPLTVIEERTVGPDLGADSITAGTRGVYISVILVACSMLLIYAAFGIVANIALVFNLILLISALALTGSTLTLPGIAGIALTMGMAVDANVLIYERIKEELRLGRHMNNAIDSGYKRAMATIMDSNLTTLIGAAALYFFGSGPIKGFGVTLAFGIILSMFTAISLTRVIIVGWIKWRKPQTLSI